MTFDPEKVGLVCDFVEICLVMVQDSNPCARCLDRQIRFELLCFLVDVNRREWLRHIADAGWTRLLLVRDSRYLSPTASNLGIDSAVEESSA